MAIDALYHQKPLTDKVRSRLKRLTDMGIVEHAGRNKYVLARSLYAATGQTGVHTRRVGLDRDTNKELLLKHIRSNGKSGTPLKELYQVLPGHSRSQIVNWLQVSIGITHIALEEFGRLQSKSNQKQLLL